MRISDQWTAPAVVAALAQVVVAAVAVGIALWQPGRLARRQQCRDEVGARNLAWLVARVIIDHCKYREGAGGRSLRSDEIAPCDRTLAAIPIHLVTEISEPLARIDFMWAAMKDARNKPSFVEIRRVTEEAMDDLDTHLLRKGIKIQCCGQRLARITWEQPFRASARMFRLPPTGFAKRLPL